MKHIFSKNELSPNLSIKCVLICPIKECSKSWYRKVLLRSVYKKVLLRNVYSLVPLRSVIIPCPYKECKKSPFRDVPLGSVFCSTHLHGIWKVPLGLVFQFEHTLKGQKCPMKAIYTLFEKYSQLSNLSLLFTKLTFLWHMML